MVKLKIINLYYMSLYLTIFIAGFGGGMVRGLVGFIKHQYSYKKVNFDLAYFLTMMFISGIIGLLCAIAIKELGLTFFNLPSLTAPMAFIIGYAGGDFLENVFKIAFKKENITSLADYFKKSR